MTIKDQILLDVPMGDEERVKLVVDIVDTTREMRIAQKKYFAKRGRDDLFEAKRLERILDKQLEALEDGSR